jgi:broad specificity phosphatase PhoE
LASLPVIAHPEPVEGCKKEIILRLTLVRHGETVWNQLKKIQGITDVELSKLGMEQARKLSLSLQNERFDRIVSSPLKRAYDTAQAIAVHHQLPITVDNDLQELNAGELEGLTFTDLQLRYAEFLGKWMSDHASVTMPQGESLKEVQDRVWPVIERITAMSENVLVVSHSFVIITILCKVRNLSLSHSKEMRVGVASKTCLEIENGTIEVAVFNDTDHLRQNYGQGDVI